MPKIKNYLLLLILAVLAIGNVFYLIGVSAYGAEISALARKEAVLTGQIQNYREQIMAKSSLLEIGKKAENLGFVKAQNVIYLTGESAVVAKLP